MPVPLAVRPPPAQPPANPEAGAQRFSVPNQNGDVLFAHNGSARAGQVLAQGEDIGLSIALTTGNLREPGSVHGGPSPSGAPPAVDPAALFQAADPSQRPRFEGDKKVVPGSFLMNGKRIEVRGDDSISSVLQRMAENLPALAPSFADDKVRLSLRTRMRKPLVFEGDSSGFVAAAGLEQAAREAMDSQAAAQRAVVAYADGRRR